MTGRDRILTAVLSCAAASAFVAYGRIEGLLSAMHPAGAPARGLADLAPPTRFPDADAAQAAKDGWAAVFETGGGPRPETIATSALVLDFVLAIAVPLLLWRLLVHVRGYLLAAGAGPAGPYRTIVDAAIVCAFAAGIADVVENAGLLATVHADRADGWVLGLTSAAALAKWLALAGAAAPLVLAGGWLLLRGGARVRTLRTLAAVRVQAVIAALFAFLLFGPILGPQAADVILRWVDEPHDEVVGVAITLLLAWIVWRTADWLVALEQTAAPEPVPDRLLLVLGGALAAFGGLAELTFEQGRGLLPLGGLLLAVWLLSLPIPSMDDHFKREPLGPAPTLAPVLVAGAIPIAAGVAVVGATAAEWLYSEDGRYFWVVVAGVALQAAGWAMIARGRLVPAPVTAGQLKALIACALVTAFIAWRVLANPWQTADQLGVLGVYAAAGCALALIALVVLVEHAWRPAPALRALGLRRFPVLGALIAWAVLAALQDQGGYHDVRTLTDPATPVSLDAAWTDWSQSRTWEEPAGGGRPAEPLVLVAASGGGIRAAYWTARAMDCAIDGRSDAACGGPRQGGDALFLASGISGGSVGLAQWAANRLDGDPAGWIDGRLGDDFLSPALAWTLFADLPSALLHTDLGPDRAEVLERAWEQAWTERDRSIAALLYKRGPASEDAALARGLGEAGDALPLLHFGSTNVRDGCRISVSRLDGDPSAQVPCTAPARDVAAGSGLLSATVDAFDVCEDRDLRLSSAALLSARFPIVSPSGRLGPEACEGGPLFGVDGGYFDNTAASPVLELWDALEPKVLAFNRDNPDRCIVPVLLQLDNSYEDPAPPDAPRRPLELAAPVQTFGATRAGREANSRQAAALRFGRSFGDVGRVRVGTDAVRRYVHLFPQRHPGTTAPLGWTLSQPSMDSLREQLYAGENAEQLTHVRRWFDPALTCE